MTSKTSITRIGRYGYGEPIDPLDVEYMTWVLFTLRIANNRNAHYQALRWMDWQNGLLDWQTFVPIT